MMIKLIKLLLLVLTFCSQIQASLDQEYETFVSTYGIDLHVFEVGIPTNAQSVGLRAIVVSVGNQDRKYQVESSLCFRPNNSDFCMIQFPLCEDLSEVYVHESMIGNLELVLSLGKPDSFEIIPITFPVLYLMEIEKAMHQKKSPANSTGDAIDSRGRKGTREEAEKSGCNDRPSK